MNVMPNAHRAIISERKILEYLLNPDHPDGSPKAAFFAAMGYGPANWRALRRSLEVVAYTGQVRAVTATRHGQKYKIDGVMSVPRGGTAKITTIWIIDTDAVEPRFVTAYPAEERDDART
jgi:hypothetical protein